MLEGARGVRMAKATVGQGSSIARRTDQRTQRRAACSVGVVSEDRYLCQRQPAGLIRALRAAGHPVELLEPTALVTARRLAERPPEVLVVRGRSDDVLWLVDLAEAAGATVVDSARSVRAVRDKLEMDRRLRGADVPLPGTYPATAAALARVPDDAFPLVLKPRFGDNARGIRLVHDRAALDRAGLDRDGRGPDGQMLAQSFVPGDGRDLKLYGVGRRVVAVRRPSPVDLLPGRPGALMPVELVPVTDALRALAHRCAEVFGLGLYGVDCIETPAGPVVIEVNDFPNFTGVPDADFLLAAHVARAAVEATR
jgi:ribosomal protein S6--L-glutamate ligase